jgi:DNA-binding beta-propeller fold protein YncE
MREGFGSSFALAAALALFVPAAGAEAVRYAYISNAAEGSVSILELETDRVVGTVRIGEMAAHGIAASPDGRYGYAALEGENEVLVIDGAAQRVVQRIAVPYSDGMAQHGLDISPDGRYLWIGARHGGENRGEVVLAEMAVINTATREVEDVLQTGLGVPSHYAMTPNGKELWVASTTVDLIWVIDTAARRVAAAIPVVPPKAERSKERRDELAGARIIALNEVAISPDGLRAYAVGPVNDLVFVLDVPARKVIGTVKSGRSAHGIAVSRDGSEVWTADWDGTLTVIDAHALRVKDTLRIGGRPNHIAFSLDGSKAYVTRTGADPERGELVILETASRSVAGTVAVGKGPHEISLEGTLPAGTPAAGASAGASDPSAAPRKQDRGAGGVTFAARPAERSFLQSKGVVPDRWGFLVELDTHSVDLMSIDVASRATLRTAPGAELKPLEWRGLSEDSHHRSGLLLFSRNEAEKQGIETDNPGALELVLHDVAGVKQRVLRWE